ncbi:hypothetical protein MF621_004005 (plasmid) [Bacillus velezensis]|uniref:hypothetical protein n=1 Tax=Bacillus velezensis TaxID=492670 RepID=UPI0004A00C8F|nr:hypothetical protein [Bacillus velezensis]KDN91185.1 hypothetical protein EF87_20270 [Bacillus amyloliquefaciens]URJ76464.1 hypothetical protein MF619_004043 [Bacillus velezensis]URJ80420.1 hypothetical protein MF621_004005 [Bacillus velezensis]
MSDDTTFYKLQYDKTVDKDIDEWLNSFPRSRKAEAVRHALRYYIAASKSSKEPFKMITDTQRSQQQIQTDKVSSNTSNDTVEPDTPKKKPKLNMKSILSANE